MKVCHITDYRKDAPDRALKAQESWPLFSDTFIPIETSRRFKEDLPSGGSRSLSYLKDVLNEALLLSNHEIIVFTNDDIQIHEGLREAVIDKVGLFGFCSCRRMDFNAAEMPSPKASLQEVRETGEAHMGRDLFAFEREWLLRNIHAMPDFVLGASVWDLWMVLFFQKMAGVPFTKNNLGFLDQNGFDLDPGYLSHEKHAATWAQAANYNRLPSQKHNRRAFQRGLPEVQVTPW